MLFKNITNFNDLYNITENELSVLILNHSKDLKRFTLINNEDLEYNSQLSKIIYFLIKTIRERKQEDFDICFETSLEYLKNSKIDSMNNFTYIIEMLFFIKKTFGFDLENWLDKYYKIIMTKDITLDLLWLGESIVINKYCNKNTIEYILSKLTWQHENDFLDMLSKYCKKTLNIKDYYMKYAKRLENIASKEKDFKSIYFYELAIDIYNRYSKTIEVDRIKLIKNEIPYNLQEHTITLSENIQKDFDTYIENLKDTMDSFLEKHENNKVFHLVFSNDMIPSKEENILNTINNQNIFKKLGNITSIGDGTKLTFTSEADKKRYLEFENYCISLDINNHILSQLLNHIKGQMDIYSFIDTIYKNSELHNDNREKIIKDLLARYKNNDIIGFNYIFLPTFEYLIKEIMKLNNFSPYKTLKEEDKSLNKLLENAQDILEKIYGKDFYYLLENLFSYKFGLNIRNSLLHGEGMSFLDKKYTDILFFILVVLITYSRRVKDV